ncbi:MULTISPECIES: hypothetical protein [unclassified Ensifer]|uniref:hypothetical protein n=1 Tax=unclassified Ensifer TaxID=2633371 RepID=UPI000708B02C|nr:MULTISPECIES: hypothetical protein [unclassified Ensifer]KQW43164.1 hypothetical protein ASD02_35375 [Ensifer sp. Root1252]KRC67102.1 hypothetical protein ASE32_35605 [Ensifer sp. Root231]KRC93681.1 hypothetical protein ASE47_35460 [Ensifer sp. Root258]
MAEALLRDNNAFPNDFVLSVKATMSRSTSANLGGFYVPFSETIIGIAGSVLVTAALVCPFVLIYRPSAAGPFGVGLLFLLSGYFVINGKSAFTEITAAVFAVGAFLLAALVALARIAEAAFRQSTGRSLDLDNIPMPLDDNNPELLVPKNSGRQGKWAPAARN